MLSTKHNLDEGDVKRTKTVLMTVSRQQAKEQVVAVRTNEKLTSNLL